MGRCILALYRSTGALMRITRCAFAQGHAEKLF